VTPDLFTIALSPVIQGLIHVGDAGKLPTTSLYKPLLIDASSNVPQEFTNDILGMSVVP